MRALDSFSASNRIPSLTLWLCWARWMAEWNEAVFVLHACICGLGQRLHSNSVVPVADRCSCLFPLVCFCFSFTSLLVLFFSFTNFSVFGRFCWMSSTVEYSVPLVFCLSLLHCTICYISKSCNKAARMTYTDGLNSYRPCISIQRPIQWKILHIFKRYSNTWTKHTWTATTGHTNLNLFAIRLLANLHRFLLRGVT